MRNVWEPSPDARPARGYFEGEVIGGGLYRQGGELPRNPKDLKIGTRVARKDYREQRGIVTGVGSPDGAGYYDIEVQWDSNGEKTKGGAEGFREALSDERITQEDEADRKYTKQ